MFNLGICKLCSCKLIIDCEETIASYYIEYSNNRILYPNTEPPYVLNYFIIKCENPACKFNDKISFEQALKQLTEWWSKVAWSYSLQDNKTKVNFHEHFTNYLILRGLNSIVTIRDIEGNKVLRDYIKYAEGKLTEDSDN